MITAGGLDPITLPVEARLLLACALHNALVSPRQLRSLASEVRDWPAVVRQATHHLSLPVLRERLSEIEDCVPSEIMAELDRAVIVATAHNLQLSAIAVELNQSWFQPKQVRFALFKGVAVAQRYYGSVSGRSCRDLDLLVSANGFADTMTHLIAQGFRLSKPFELPADPGRHGAHIDAMCGLNREISMRAPSGPMVDLHQSVDLTGADFPTDELLERAETITIAGETLPVFSTADLFVYICYHHSRHRWSRLHWIGDLGRIAAAPDFDIAAMRAQAKRAGLEKLVLACLEMPALLVGAVAGGWPVGPGLAARMTRDCIRFLHPDNAAPELERHSRTDDRLFRWRDWFATTAIEWRQREGLGRRARAVGRSLVPSWQAYRDLPLPRGLRWLYVPWRAAAHMVRYFPLPKFGRKDGKRG
ncbi:hypothetical protein GCM10009087_22800 [Sphingomonas oligophenolica]|uniref:Nucleotidyltransferase family protein n=1 Tax=Sphingomonas oligophenolica TaxID=301154 RepID=A0ABU9Y1R8_9SPHN